MLAIPASVLVSDCCHAIIIIDDKGKYVCCMCTKQCKSDGTLGDYYDRLARDAQPTDEKGE